MQASNANCTVRDTTTIFVLPLPIGVLPKSVSFCKNKFAVIDATTSTATQYLWNTGSTQSNLHVTTDGLYKVKLTTANGCINYDSCLVITYDTPVIKAIADIYTLANTQVQLTAIASSNAIKFLWQPTTNLSNPTTLNTWLQATKNEQYIVTAYTTNNCTASDTVNVKVSVDLHIPNVFSPNGDKINDTWDIADLSAYSFSTTTVFDRYGNKVFETLGNKKTWNGKYFNTGNNVPTGTYYYVITFTDNDNVSKTISGSVTVLR